MTDKQLGFEINGEFHDMPLVGSFDMDENRIFYKATGLHAEDVWLGLQDGGDLSFSELMRNEGFLQALVHIAYRRENDGMSDERIAVMVGKINRLELFASMVNSMTPAEEDESPLEESTSGHSERSTSGTDEKQSSKPGKGKRSGKTSKRSSERPDGTPGSIGTGGTDMSSTSDRLRRVV